MKKAICIGAGPAGLTAAYLLSKEGVAVTVVEKDPVYVGGISKTIVHNGFCFDIGGHRFFSKSAEVEKLWDEILGRDFLKRPRKSRIFYRSKFFSYPLKPFEALMNLGVITSTHCVFSYIWIRIFPYRNPKNFEEWVTNNFGRKLFEIFFKTYTEKVWGMKCREISVDWAAQRIKGLSLWVAIRNAFFPQKKAGSSVKTLIDSFRYPRKGPGMMWEKAAEKIKIHGGEVRMGADAFKFLYLPEKKVWQVHCKVQNGATEIFEAEHIVSSTPLKELVTAIHPLLPSHALQAAHALRYRDFLIVALVVHDMNIFDDNWIYIHDPAVRVGRIQNFKSWSPEMIPDPSMNCYGMEYFCFEGDGLWQSSDDELVKLAMKEIGYLGLAEEGDIKAGYVVRQKKAYPVYDEDYAKHVDAIRNSLEENCPGLHLVGRNGMHKYNNQDHAMMTAMLTAKNIMAGKQIYDVWKVNQDAEYHETQTSEEQSPGTGLRSVPKRSG